MCQMGMLIINSVSFLGVSGHSQIYSLCQEEELDPDPMTQAHQLLMQVFIWLYIQFKLLKFVQYLQIK